MSIKGTLAHCVGRPADGKLNDGDSFTVLVSREVFRILGSGTLARCVEVQVIDSAGNVLARSVGGNVYMPAAGNPLVSMSDQALSPAGGNQPHNNLSPYLTVTFCIALQGIFPSHS